MITGKRKKTITLLSKFLLVISSLLCAALFLSYTTEPDFCAALTFWPVWIWAIAGIILSLIALGVNKEFRLAVASVWILLVIFEAEEPLALLRSCLYSSRDCKSYCPKGNCLRIISLNCAGANPDAAEELIRYAPDIVLLQESPQKKYLETLAQKLFADKGEFVLEGDTAILARGRITNANVSQENQLPMTAARVTTPSGIEVETVSVHLAPPATAVNLLSPACWREHFEDRQQRLKEIISIEKHLETITPNVPLIVGGDFNAVLWRRANRVLSSKLNDTFQQSGIGWPGTGPAHFPLWRIDQIWVSKHFAPIKVWSEPSKNSDHRIVICDLCAL
jgi:vancomycin resistance protein VanJ